jgi:uncharacterized protein (TIGR03437 family)
MSPGIWLAAALIGSSAAGPSASRQAPSYSAASVVNAASNQAGAIAPNTFVTIYGQNLAWVTRGLSGEDLTGDQLPTVLSGTGVRVWIGQIAANVYYVSPEQINVLVPSNLKPGTMQMRVQVDSIYGPALDVTLTRAAPALFQMDASGAIAVHGDGSVATSDAPARPGEIVALYATGLGATTPAAVYSKIPHAAAPLNDMNTFEVRLDGKPLDPLRMLYAGVAPGFAGLYQINIKLPDDIGDNPEIRLTASGVLSPEGIRIPVGR